MLVFILVIAMWTSFVAGMAQLMCGAAWKRVMIAKLIGLVAGGLFAWVAAEPLMTLFASNNAVAG